ncbi:uncharacterized protein FFNC_15400 [Fusarium fujikuroi]|nr:uncharacterized protein FFNC_15400 [Fusarium fujikuroi]
MIVISVSEQYVVQDIFDECAYGVACSATYKPSGQKVAVKKITPFDHSMFDPPASAVSQWQQELKETGEHQVIRTQDLSDDHCKHPTYQTLRVLKAMHSANVLPRDLKPANLLVNASCDLRICDLSLARSTGPDGQ